MPSASWCEVWGGSFGHGWWCSRSFWCVMDSWLCVSVRLQVAEGSWCDRRPWSWLTMACCSRWAVWIRITSITLPLAWSSGTRKLAFPGTSIPTVISISHVRFQRCVVSRARGRFGSRLWRPSVGGLFRGWIRIPGIHLLTRKINWNAKNGTVITNRTNCTIHISYLKIHHSEPKPCHFCSEWSITGCGTSVLWDLWD